MTPDDKRRLAKVYQRMDAAQNTYHQHGRADPVLMNEYLILLRRLLDEATAERDTAQTICAEAYQARPRCSTPSQEDTGSGCGERWRHKKRGTTYTLIGEGVAQASNDDIQDGDPVVLYQSDDTGKLWVRPADEFHDGRFERLPPTDAARHSLSE